METKYTIYAVGAEPEHGSAKIPPEPGYDLLQSLVVPILQRGRPDGERCWLEHVSVLHDGERRDMFVDEDGKAKFLPVNAPATAIYRNNWLTQHPGAEPDDLPAIYGTAILFDRRVWF